jgi:anti-sigma regulatory factor (Ser/Thr protein kinase)
MIGPSLEVQLPRTLDAPWIARQRLTEWMPDTFEQSDLERARLLVSELVTNALIHGQGIITLRATDRDGRLLVEVIDEGGGFEREIRARDFDELGGRGLAIVDSQASRWGVHEGTTHVWFELEPTGPRLGAAENPLS